MIGQQISHYKILERLGEGGMGVVYRAVDTLLDRPVALKLLSPESVGNQDRADRFVREAKAASALNHPNIVTIYEIGKVTAGPDVQDFIAMEFVDGQALGDLVPRDGLPIDEALGYAVQIAGALAAAHDAGIVHRDIKPANIMVTRDGLIKVVDFGLAKLLGISDFDDSAPTLSAGVRTEEGVILGTCAFMSPEQAEGKPVDARSDVFSFGSVLYEILTGERPFHGETHVLILSSVLHETPPPLRTARTGTPADLERVVARCLAKGPASRYPSASELADDLRKCESRLIAARTGIGTFLLRPRIVLPLSLLLAALVGAGVWFYQKNSRIQWARDTALPEITRLAGDDNYHAAFRLAREAKRHLPEDRELERLWEEVATPVSVTTDPPGADIYFRDYNAIDADWELLGRAPVDSAFVPGGYLRWRVIKDGSDPVERAFSAWVVRNPHFELDEPAPLPSGMVRVSGGPYAVHGSRNVQLDDYWLDRYEVTNRAFKEFVDAGGYDKREYWKEPILENGSVLDWTEAMTRFRDATGQPGPADWELGIYPDGRAEVPVTGISWYEAAAYAEFTGKSLPTVYHWYKAAAGLGLFSDVLHFSNFGDEGPAAVGKHPSLSPYGNYDMAGNVKEWCWNQAGGRRYILGGAWDEPSYMFGDADAQDPLVRSARNGFRCVWYAAPVSEKLTGSIEDLSRDYRQEQPVDADVFEIYTRFYGYDKTDLAAVVESIDESSAYWRKEKITFDAAYGNERLPAFLFLPRNAKPPYQTVILFPSGSAFMLRSSKNLDLRFADFIVRSGRALLIPIYNGTYERQNDDDVGGPNLQRDLRIQWSKEFRRSLDYLETRADIDHERMAFQGVSAGAIVGPVLLALENRLKVGVFVAGGLPPKSLPSEVDPIHFAPRVKIPMLMVNGRNDFELPLESSQVPLFRFLGASDRDKRHVLFDTGHIPPRTQTIKATLEWLDRHLGPVEDR